MARRSRTIEMRNHTTILLAAGAVLALAAAPATAQTLAPLPASDYASRPACARPAPGHAGCLAVELVPLTREASAHTHPLGIVGAGQGTAPHTGRSAAGRGAALEAGGPASGAYGLRPEDLRAAYFPGEAAQAPAAAPQTIALVDAYNDPQAEADLKTYDEEFGLEACDAANGCFEKVNQKGELTNLPFPASEAEREQELAVCNNSKAAHATREAACERVSEAEGWAVEISTDIEIARAICQHNCHIVLVEAGTSSRTSPEETEASFENLEAAEKTAVRIGRQKEASPPCEAPQACDTEVSNSWGGSEPLLESAAFEHPGTAIVAAAGDYGYLNWTDAAEAEAAGEQSYSGADYPASSPHVVAVGGTRLTLAGGAYGSESVWNDDHPEREENYGAGGGGCSTELTAPEWQRAVPDWAQVGCGTGVSAKRAVADVAADGDPYSGVAVYDSVPTFHEALVNGKLVLVNTPLGWWPIGGTSVAAPIVASMFALAGGSHGVEYPAKTLYEHLGTGLLHPVTEGGNGECDDFYASCAGSLNPLSARFAFDCGAGALICNAGPGYNGPTGVGTPDGVGAFQPL
ncbi:MAG TPA: S8 family serine peptidase, partial [Solirubrobacteraceae bacterium]|nr:S8 family serine peptidase [Solirubrobacteraceae bacterium]